MRSLIAFATALVFGFGLAVARLTDPSKILAFLDVAGRWYAGPLIVMGLGVVLYALAYRLLMRRRRPFLAASWSLPARKDIDVKLVTGALLFGVGWGLGGYCPGPALTGLAYGKVGTITFVLAMLCGAAVEPLVTRAWQANSGAMSSVRRRREQVDR